MYEFFPGSGDQDDLQSNIINEPLDPLWKSKHDMTMGMAHRGGVGRGGVGGGGHGTRSRTSSSKARLENNPGEQEILPPRAGRLCYREAIQRRLLPALRAFNPQLIMLSAGFDAAKGDVGNCKQGARAAREGLDLSSEDYLWTTEKIQSVADICCGGKLVSVLEGGYGQNQCESMHSGSRGAGMPSSMARCA
ncbi:unnamed protein product [Ectocarpus sp. 8 AP-2014]